MTWPRNSIENSSDEAQNEHLESWEQASRAMTQRDSTDRQRGQLWAFVRMAVMVAIVWVASYWFLVILGNSH
jgi:hypothetical protein